MECRRQQCTRVVSYAALHHLPWYHQSPRWSFETTARHLKSNLHILKTFSCINRCIIYVSFLSSPSVKTRLKWASAISSWVGHGYGDGDSKRQPKTAWRYHAAVFKTPIASRKPEGQISLKYLMFTHQSRSTRSKAAATIRPISLQGLKKEYPISPFAFVAGFDGNGPAKQPMIMCGIPAVYVTFWITKAERMTFLVSS